MKWRGAEEVPMLRGALRFGVCCQEGGAHTVQPQVIQVITKAESLGLASCKDYGRFGRQTGRTPRKVRGQVNNEQSGHVELVSTLL